MNSAGLSWQILGSTTVIGEQQPKPIGAMFVAVQGDLTFSFSHE